MADKRAKRREPARCGVAAAAAAAFCAFAAHTLFADATLDKIAIMDEAEAKAAGTVVVNGIVTFVSGIDSNSFVVAFPDAPNRRGVTVVAAPGIELPQTGDCVQVDGEVVWKEPMAAIAADRVEFIRTRPLPAAPGAKQADFRRGILTNRRISLHGIVSGIETKETSAGAVSSVSLYIDNYTAHLLVPGILDAKKYLGEDVRVEGLATAHYGKEGDLLDVELEVADENDIALLSVRQVPVVLLVAAGVCGAALLFFAGMFLVLWLKSMRERRNEKVIAAERRRMAADLHDTIEQHLAGANLIAAGVLALEDVPADVVEAMKTLGNLLANAKAEVRSAVMNLRGAGVSGRKFEDAIGEIASSLAKTGVRTRKFLRGLPEAPGEGLHQDILLILREAATNAVKHGKARVIVFTCDPVKPKGFVIRVLNDGAPFEVTRALGPETGHYGLSGMKERALRNHLSIAWGRKGKWTYVEVRSGL